jgi:predicted nucleotidyltransferase
MTTKLAPTQTEGLLSDIVERLRQVDPNLCAIVLFGSFVWTPELARDVDVAVISTAPLPLDAYEDAVNDLPLPVDIVVLRRGEKAGRLALALRVGVCLWGDRNALREATEEMPVPTFDEARAVLRRARDYLQMGLRQSDPVYRHMDIRNAFNALFDAARLAAMCFLDTEETRWGELRRSLPSPLNERFRRIIETLHVAYFYHGQYPHEQVADAFDRWQGEVATFVDELERLKGAPQISA